SHDIESARRYERVLCMNRRQVAYGPPAETLTRAVLEQTYGSEIVVIDGSCLLDPLQSSIGRHALIEVTLLGALSGALGFWVVSYGLSYGAESLAHGL